MTSVSKSKVTAAELARHASASSAWVCVDGRVYDVTAFLDAHPGGRAVLLAEAGGDATAAFAAVHSPDTLSALPAGSLVGEMEGGGAAAAAPTAAADARAEFEERSRRLLPPLEEALNVMDLEALAPSMMSREGFAYYSSGADDEVTLRENRAAFARVWVRPRVLVDVREVDTSTAMLGAPASFPVYVTATALGRLAHPDGEAALAAAAGGAGVVQMLPTLASCSLEEMAGARLPGATQWFQLYVNPDRRRTAALVRRAEALGCRALVVTVDAPRLGRREKDMRQKFRLAGPREQQGDQTDRSRGVARSISAFIDPSLSWSDLAWLRSLSGMPLVIKGVQCGEDAVLAVRHGAAAIVVSNHGGRQMDYCRSALEVLPEVTEALRAAGLRTEVYVDGGVRRGSDVFKALALGARAVGVGRPVLYGLATYGERGARRALEMLREEFDMCMALAGCRSVSDIRPEMVLAGALSHRSAGAAPRDSLADAVYRPLEALRPRL